MARKKFYLDSIMSILWAHLENYDNNAYPK